MSAYSTWMASRDEDIARKKQEQQAEADYEDKHNLRRQFHEHVSAFGHRAVAGGHKAIDAVNRGMDMQARSGPEGIPGAFPGSPDEAMDLTHRGADMVRSSPHEARVLSGQVGNFVQDQITSGAMPEYSRKMQGDSDRANDPAQAEAMQQFEQKEPFYKYGGKIATGIAGIAENALWMIGYGAVGKTMQPIARFLPRALHGLVTGATAGAAISSADGYLEERLKGENPHDLSETTAFNAIVGGIAGTLGPGDAAITKEVLPHLWNAAGGKYGKSVREMQRVAGRVGGKDWSPQLALNKVARFAQGNGDQVVAAKIRQLSRTEPELFKDPLTEKLRQAAHRNDAGEGKPAVGKLAPGELRKAFVLPEGNAPPLKGSDSPGGRRGPLGILIDENPPKKGASLPEKGATTASGGALPPRTPPGGRGNDVVRTQGPKVAGPTTHAGQQKLVDSLMKMDPNVAETAEMGAARRQVSFMAVNGQLKPEHITDGKIARRVNRALARTASELDGKDGFAVHFDAMREWAQRARVLDAAPEFDRGPIDRTNPVHLVQLEDEIDKGRQTNAIAAGPGKRPVTKAMLEKKRGKKPKFC